MQPKRSTITRRSAFRLLALAGAALLAPSTAAADTESDLAAAQSRLANAEAQLDAIATEYEALSEEQSSTLDKLDKVRKQVKRISQRISSLEVRLQKKQRELAVNVSEEYKDGNHGVVDLILGSSTIDELISNFYYYDKVIEDKTRLIQDVKDTKAELVAEQEDLEEQQANLEEVSRVQEQQLDAMRAKQYEAQEVINGLDEEVRELIAKRDAEILAAQQEAERARKQREEAERAAAQQAAAQQAASSSESATESPQTSPTATGSAASAPSSSATESEASPAQTATTQETVTPEEEPPAAVTDVEEDHVTDPYASSTGSASAVVASCMSTPSPGPGLCAGWCSDVMINAGYGFVAGNANDMYAEFCFSSSRADLMPGMAVAVSTHPHTTAGRIYGHIGMYIGGGMMMDNVGYIRTISVDEWCAYYGETVPPRWGWLNGIVLR